MSTVTRSSGPGPSARSAGSCCSMRSGVRAPVADRFTTGGTSTSGERRRASWSTQPASKRDAPTACDMESPRTNQCGPGAARLGAVALLPRVGVRLDLALHAAHARAGASPRVRTTRPGPRPVRLS